MPVRQFLLCRRTVRQIATPGATGSLEKNGLAQLHYFKRFIGRSGGSLKAKHRAGGRRKRFKTHTP